MTGPLTGILIFLSALLLVALSNLASLRRLGSMGQSNPARPQPKVSILLPVRDEQDNLEPCLRSLLAQDYPDFEVLVLDDHSTDATGMILQTLAASDSRLHTLPAQPLPEGWLGKLWANHQLAQAAQGDLLLFIDADTRHKPRLLSSAVAAQQVLAADLLAILPQQLTPTWGERLLVPVLYWSLLCFLPVGLAHRVRLPALSYAIGQCLLLRQAAYWQVGGFAAIRSNPADDLALARQIKAAGLRWRLVDGTDHVQTRMYTGFSSAFEGLSKNLIAAFGYRMLPFLFVWIWNAISFLGPLLVLAAAGAAWLWQDLIAPPGDAVIIAGAGAGIGLALWFLTAWRFRFPLSIVQAYPMIIVTACLAAFTSLLLTAQGKTTWKGRTLVKPRLKLF